MADKATQLVLDALARAAADPAGTPLFTSKSHAGLFPLTPAGRLAARRCKDAGYVRIIGNETRGKTEFEVAVPTDSGLAYLLSHTDPQQVLEDLVRALDARRTQIGELIAASRRWQASTEALSAIASTVLRQLSEGSIARADEMWMTAIQDHLMDRHTQDACGDTALPDLYRLASQAAPELTIGRFHDGLRRLYDQRMIYLHPWTGPLSELPEPHLAVLVGHEVAYYASARQSEPRHQREFAAFSA